MTSQPSGVCPLCSRPTIVAPPVTKPDVFDVTCKACGQFTVTGSFMASSIEPHLKEKIGFWTRDEYDLGQVAAVTSHTTDFVAHLPEKSIKERADRLLRYGIRAQKYLGATFELTADSAAGYTHSRSSHEVRALAELLQSRGWMKGNYPAGVAIVTPEGFMHASEGNAADSSIGFIAMWFDPSMDRARMQGLEPAIRGAGYEPLVVSGVEHINKIDDEIVSQIRRSRFLVADFTGHRGGVYFEAGFAMGLGLPVFWACRKDNLAKLHFDIRQYNCIDWADEAELAQRLHRRIEAVIGRGPIKEPDVG